MTIKAWPWKHESSRDKLIYIYTYIYMYMYMYTHTHYTFYLCVHSADSSGMDACQTGSRGPWWPFLWEDPSDVQQHPAGGGLRPEIEEADSLFWPLRTPWKHKDWRKDDHGILPSSYYFSCLENTPSRFRTGLQDLSKQAAVGLADMSLSSMSSWVSWVRGLIFHVCCLQYTCWLVIWNIFGIFPCIGNLIIPIDSYFSEGFKPPTSLCWWNSSIGPSRTVITVHFDIFRYLFQAGYRVMALTRMLSCVLWSKTWVIFLSKLSQGMVLNPWIGIYLHIYIYIYTYICIYMYIYMYL